MSSSPGLQSVAGDPKHVFRFVARQPILNRDQQVFAYELLFRDGIENFFRATDAEAAARSTRDSTLLMGFDVLCNGHKAFINCTRDLLLKEGITLLPAEQTVVEVLETVAADDLVVAACERLRAAGYLIALDDFVTSDPRASMAGSVDFVKVDFERTTATERSELVKRYGTPRCRMLAEKVETREQFEKSLKDGFDYFQGYFFRRPEVLKAREIPANQVNYLRMLQTVGREEIDIRELEGIIKSEASVLYRLLRYLNSPLFGMRHEIHSIRHALAILASAQYGAGSGWWRWFRRASRGPPTWCCRLWCEHTLRTALAEDSAHPIGPLPGRYGIDDGRYSGRADVGGCSRGSPSIRTRNESCREMAATCGRCMN